MLQKDIKKNIDLFYAKIRYIDWVAEVNSYHFVIFVSSYQQKFYNIYNRDNSSGLNLFKIMFCR